MLQGFIIFAANLPGFGIPLQIFPFLTDFSKGC
jgi:hypothetical protein